MTSVDLPPAPITDEVRAAARANPGQFVYCLDPDWPTPDGAVPGWAVRGLYAVDEQGAVVEASYRPNPRYRPGPRARGLPEPATVVERALELAATGYAPERVVPVALADAELCWPVDPARPEHLTVIAGAGEGLPELLAFTAPARIPPQVTHWQAVPVAGLGRALSGVVVHLNPGLPLSARVPGRDIDAVFARRRTGGGRGDAQGTPGVGRVVVP